MTLECGSLLPLRHRRAMLDRSQGIHPLERLSITNVLRRVSDAWFPGSKLFQGTQALFDDGHGINYDERFLRR